MSRTGIAPVAIAGLLLLLAGCQDRSRARVDGTDPVVDAGALDVGLDVGLDAAPIEPIRDAGLPETAPDGAPDSAADAAALPFDERDVYRRATQHQGRADCPRISPVRSLSVERPHWYVTARIAHIGLTLEDEWVSTPIRPPDGPGIPEYGGADVALQALRWAGPTTLIGLWRDPIDGVLRTGPLGNGGWVDAGAQVHGPIADIPAAFDTAVAPSGLGATLLPTDEGLVLVLDAGADAQPRILDWPVQGLERARVAADEEGVVLAWSTPDAIEVRAVDPMGQARWSARLDAAAPGFDLALRPGRVGVVHVLADERLLDRPYAQGYGAPTLSVLHRSDGAGLWSGALHPESIRGGDPAIGARGDGWMTAWARLRVDGDRNRTEIEASVIADERIGPPLRITRAHGFSFCPDVGDALDGESVIAWMDTRFGREDILTAHGTFADWPGPDRPEPTPAPPEFPERCDLAVAAVPGPVSGFDAAPIDGGFRAVWIDGDGTISAGDINPGDGPTVIWQLPPGDRPPSDVRITPVDDGAWIFGVWDDRVRRWRAERAPPNVPIEAAEPIEPPLHAVAAGPDGAVVVAGDPPVARLLDNPRAIIRPLPADARSISALAVGGGVIVGWLQPDPEFPDTASRLAVLTLRAQAPPDDPEDAIWSVGVPLSAGDGGLWLDGPPADGGWRYVYSAHRGRGFARSVMVYDGTDQRRAPLLDVDAASSRRPVGHAGGTVWLEERPVQRYQVHFAPIGAGLEAVERLPIPGPQRSRFFLNVIDGDPVVLWTAGAEVFIARFPPECRLPAATRP